MAGPSKEQQLRERQQCAVIKAALTPLLVLLDPPVRLAVLEELLAEELATLPAVCRPTRLRIIGELVDEKTEHD